VIAVKGDIYRHHFRHAVDTIACTAARETALHQFAKQIICDEMECSLPLPGDLGDMQSAVQELWLDGIRPDILATYASERVGIEIYVTHRVPPEKLEMIYQRELTTVEIDLSYHRDAELTEEQLRNAVLWSADRRWLYEPAQVRRQRQEAYERMEAEGRLLIEQERIANAEAEAARKLAADKQAALWELQRLQELEQRALRAAEAAREAEARRAVEKELSRRRELEEARAREAAEYRLGPSLQKLVVASGGYGKITPEAWTRFWGDRLRWLDRLRHGELG
jgi:hypothetical protein